MTKEWFHDVDWESLSEEKTDIACKSAIGFLQELEESQKTIDYKAIVFLFYLFAMTGALIYNLTFNSEKLMAINLAANAAITPYQLAIGLCIFYSIAFCLTSIIFLSTQRVKNKYASPKDIFLNPHVDIRHIKRDICIGLQAAISFNSKKNNKRALFLKILVFVSAILPICSILLIGTSLSLASAMGVGVGIAIAAYLVFHFCP